MCRRNVIRLRAGSPERRRWAALLVVVVAGVAALLGAGSGMAPGAVRGPSPTPPVYTQWGPPLTKTTIDGGKFIIDANGVPHRIGDTGDNTYTIDALAFMNEQLEKAGLAYDRRTRTGFEYIYQDDKEDDEKKLLVPKGRIASGALSGTTADMLKLAWSSGRLVSVDVVDATGTSRSYIDPVNIGHYSNTVNKKLPGNDNQADNVVFVAENRRQAEILAKAYQGNPHVRIIHPASRYDTGEFEAGTAALKQAAGHLFTARPSNCPPTPAHSVPRPAPGSGSGVQRAAFTVGRTADCGEQSPPKPGGLAQGLAAGARDAGGIDFTRLELRYLADPGPGNGLRYAFQAPVEASSKGSPLTGLANARNASDSFFTWLQLNPSTFWVNLSPNEPDRIIDSRLGRTETGRVLLEADLMLKKTTGKLIHPDTGRGTEYWQSLSGKCTSFRTWIVPAPATVYAKGDELHILKSPLDVQMETQYLKQHDGPGKATCPQQSAQVQEHNESQFRRMILPHVVKAVNTAPEYAELRRVYLSRIAAEWYRELSLRKSTTYGSMIDDGDVDAYVTREKWKPRDTFDAYVRSYTKGEFQVTHRTRKDDRVYMKTYIYGGVDFTDVRLTSLGADRVESSWPGLTRSVSRSLDEPTRDRGKGQAWLGGGVPAEDSHSVEEKSREDRGGGTSEALGLPVQEDDEGFVAVAGRWLGVAGVSLFGVMVLRFLIRRRRARRIPS
ncbi:hypothetical protein ACH4D5_36080 [Streptomyces sp. NPDC018029]|uniref:hypothetical protein n=1 Tax=Streptomyces sp. NPDC018029 TaxID=3365032 RepID=UPI00378F3335